MTPKIRRTIVRIAAAFALFIAALLLAHFNPGGVFGRNIQTFLMYLIPYIIVGYDVLKKAATGVINRQMFDECFLMTLATFGAFAVGEFSEAVGVMLFYQVGEVFQDLAVNRSRTSITELMDIVPESANLERDGQMTEVDPDDVEVGDIIVIRPGEKVPLDGVILSGDSFLDTSALTGESVPQKVLPGDEIFSGCINGSGILRVRVTKEFDDSTVAQILELVENASVRKAKIENFITRFAKYYTPAVVAAAAAIAVFPPLVLSGEWMEWLIRACTFLVISCPCALVISVPLSFFGGIGALSRKGVLVKGGNYVEALARMDTVVFDKTGTLTKGVFTVKELLPENVSEEELLKITAYAESASTHPIAKSVVEAYGKGVSEAEIEGLEEIAGCGVKAVISGKNVLAGNEKLMKLENIEFKRTDKSGTIIYTSVDGVYAGAIVIGDEIKPSARTAIERLKAIGVRNAVMLTGDKRNVAERTAEALGITSCHAELLPGDKVRIVEEILSQEGPKKTTAFAGDGINDAPVLMRADIGIAMGSMGSDAAIEAADVVLMDDDPTKIADSVRIARKTVIIAKENIVFALSVKGLILILGAAGIANMWAAVFADVGVAVIAILNSMRMLRAK